MSADGWTDGLVRRVSIDGLMGIGGIIGGELTREQLESVAPFLGELSEPYAAERREKHAVQATREDEQTKAGRKCTERQRGKCPQLAFTAFFKNDGPGAWKRRSRGLERAPRCLRDFIAQQRRAQQPILDLEHTLQRMQMGQQQEAQGAASERLCKSSNWHSTAARWDLVPARTTFQQTWGPPLRERVPFEQCESSCSDRLIDATQATQSSPTPLRRASGSGSGR